MTSQVVSARIGIAPQSSAGRARGGLSLPVIQGTGAVRALYGFVPLVFLMMGSDIGTGVAGPSLVIVGVVTLLLGLAVAASAPRLARDDRRVLAAVLADATAVVAGIALMLLAWDQFSVPSATIVLGAVMFSALSMVVVAVATAASASGSTRR